MTPGSTEGMEAATAERRRGRPRSDRARAAILAAGQALFLERGLDGVTVDEIADRAGASKATIYRWWPSKEHLAVDALYDDWLSHAGPENDEVPLEQELEGYLVPWVRALRRRPYGRVVAGLVARAQLDPAFAEHYRTWFVRRRRDHVGRILRRRIADGDLPATTDVPLALDLIFGPIYHRLLHGHAPVNEPYVRAIVRTVVRGLLRPNG